MQSEMLRTPVHAMSPSKRTVYEYQNPVKTRNPTTRRMLFCFMLGSMHGE